MYCIDIGIVRSVFRSGVKFGQIRGTAPPSWDPATRLGVRHLSWKICYRKIEIRHAILTGKLYWNISTTWNDRLLLSKRSRILQCDSSLLVITRHDS